MQLFLSDSTYFKSQYHLLTRGQSKIGKLKNLFHSLHFLVMVNSVIIH